MSGGEAIREGRHQAEKAEGNAFLPGGSRCIPGREIHRQKIENLENIRGKSLSVQDKFKLCVSLR